MITDFSLQITDDVRCYWKIVPVLVSRQIPDVFLRRVVAVVVLKADAPCRRVGHLGRWHRELHVTIFGQIFGDLIVGS